LTYRNAIRCATLLGITILVAIDTEALGRYYVNAAAVANSYPPGSAVLRQSSGTMRHSLHAVHAEGQIRFRLSYRAAQLQVSGDCAMRRRYLALQFWSRGTMFVNGKRRVINSRYISIQRHTWRRSPHAHNTWQSADADQGALLGLQLCPATFTWWPGMAGLVPRARNLGTVTVQSRQTWHIRILVAHFRWDFYVDQHSHDWVRLVSYSPGPPRQAAIFDYSAFNETVTIKPPRIGDSSPQVLYRGQAKPSSWR
jgi:hypothetical protein